MQFLRTNFLDFEDFFDIFFIENCQPNSSRFFNYFLKDGQI